MKPRHYLTLVLPLFALIACAVSPAHAGEWVVDHYEYERYQETKYAGADGESYNPPHLWTIVTGERDGINVNTHPRVVSGTMPAALVNQSVDLSGVASLAADYVTAATVPTKHLSLRYKVTPVYEWTGGGEPAEEFWAREWGHLSVTRTRWGEGISYSAENPYHGEGITINRAFNGFKNIPVGPETDNHFDIYGANSNSWGYCQSSFDDWPVGLWNLRHYTVPNGATEFTGPTRLLEASVTIDTVTAGATQVSTEASVRAWYMAEVCNVSLSATPRGPYTATKDTPMDKEYNGISRWQARLANDGASAGTVGPYVQKEGYVQARVEAFKGTQSDFFATAKSADGADLLPNQKYEWSAVKSPYPAVIPSVPIGQQPIGVAIQQHVDGNDGIPKIIKFLNPNQGIIDTVTSLPEWWQDFADYMDLGFNAATIPDREILEKSTRDKRLRWYHGPIDLQPINPVTVRAQATSDAADSPVINVGKVKINWKNPKKRLYEVEVFPVEWVLPHSGTAVQQFCYTFFSNEDLSTNIEKWVDVQAAFIAGGEVLGATAPAAAKKIKVLFSRDKTAAEAANEFAQMLAKRAKEQGLTEGAAGEAASGHVDTKATAVKESGEPLEGADADSATGRADIDGPECFVAGTPVLMADDSFKPIESIEVGDLVKTKDPKTGEEMGGKVLRKFRNVAPLLLALTFGNGDVITTTPTHPFATQSDGAFVPAAELTVGKNVTQSGGSFTQLKTESEQRGTFATYNFEVEKYHTYFVGECKVWVHNACSAKLNRALGGTSFDHMQAHHLIPGELETHELVKRAIDAGWDIDAGRNGLLLPDNMELSLEDNLPIHNTNHPAYTDMVRSRLNDIRTPAAGWTDAELIDALNAISDEMELYLRGLGGGVPVPK